MVFYVVGVFNSLNWTPGPATWSQYRCEGPRLAAAPRPGMVLGAGPALPVLGCPGKRRQWCCCWQGSWSGMTVSKSPRRQPQPDCTRQVSVRYRLLVKEVVELEANLPWTCKEHVPDPNKVHCFQPTVTPGEGYYQGGKLQFETKAPDACNMVPPKVEMLAQDLAPQHHRDGWRYVSVDWENIQPIAPAGPLWGHRRLLFGD